MKFQKERKNITIYVYCPASEIDKVKSILNYLEFEVIYNDYSITELGDKHLCHYKSSGLEEDNKKFLVECTENGAWVEPLVSYLDNLMGYTEVGLLHSGYFLHQKAFSILSNKRSQKIKRFIDLFSSIILFVVTLPITLLTAVAIKMDSKGTVFYKQLRTGLYNKEFYVYKFRSMGKDAEKSGAQWAQKDDMRVTRVGKFIRKTRIDELPQLINVIRGEMSIVGPRPEREVFIKKLEEEIPYYRFRHAVKPGITGSAQVSYPYGASIEDAIWKHKYDIHYIKHHRTIKDIMILFKTIKVVLFGMGR